jgi:hypothetical protein
MAKTSENWLNPTPTSNRFSALQQEDDLVNQPSPGNEATPPPPFVSPMSLSSLHYSNSLIKFPAQNQVKIQPKPSDSYRLITKALLDRNTQFHTYKPKEERTYSCAQKYALHRSRGN